VEAQLAALDPERLRVLARGGGSPVQILATETGAADAGVGPRARPRETHARALVAGALEGR
jgi:hypothetical protein